MMATVVCVCVCAMCEREEVIKGGRDKGRGRRNAVLCALLNS